MEHLHILIFGVVQGELEMSSLMLCNCMSFCCVKIQTTSVLQMTLYLHNLAMQTGMHIYHPFSPSGTHLLAHPPIDTTERQRSNAHHDNVCEFCVRLLLLDLMHGLDVAPGAQRVGPSHRYDARVQALTAQLIRQLCAQGFAANSCVLFFCHLLAA